MVTYQVVEEMLWGQDFGKYKSFGICAHQMNGEVDEPVAYISDVFLSKESADQFVNLCNRLQLDIVHLDEAISDAISGAV